MGNNIAKIFDFSALSEAKVYEKWHKIKRWRNIKHLF
jgi:hypothetical protein